MRLEDIGFYTLSDERASRAGRGPLARCELLITDACNFKCPYCRGCKPELRGTLLAKEAFAVIDAWGREGLRNIRLSGGEPTLHPNLLSMVKFARECGARRVAISTNGSAPQQAYGHLLLAGADDFSVSLDACCSSTGDRMAGGIAGAWERVVENIRFLAARAYTTVGVVLTDDNLPELSKTIELAHQLGVADIRIISAAQRGGKIEVDVRDEVRRAHPILRYRLANFAAGRDVRGLRPEDCGRCHLVKDDMATLGGRHFPCIIYLREGGEAIGRIGPEMRAERQRWFEQHDSHRDPICSKNCLDVCIDYNNRCRELE